MSPRSSSPCWDLISNEAVASLANITLEQYVSQNVYSKYQVKKPARQGSYSKSSGLYLFATLIIDGRKADRIRPVYLFSECSLQPDRLTVHLYFN